MRISDWSSDVCSSDLNGYVPVSVDAVIAADRGGAPLPNRAVLLTFDDGDASFYTRVFPILRSYGWPAVFAPVGKWVGTPAGQEVAFGDKQASRDQFVTWDQVREMAASGLIEVASHTHDLHRGILANPQRSEEHTSELQSLMRISYAVFCLKKNTIITLYNNNCI